jgi:hypothetical protein
MTRPLPSHSICGAPANICQFGFLSQCEINGDVTAAIAVNI